MECHCRKTQTCEELSPSGEAGLHWALPEIIRTQNMKSQDDTLGMRQLTGFKAEHSAFGGFVLLRSSFVDTMSYVCADKSAAFADQEVMIRLDMARALIRELQKRVDYIEAGIETNSIHPSE
jgi:hypothetical protein